MSLGSKMRAATAKVQSLAIAEGLKVLEDGPAVDRVVAQFATWADEEVRWDFLPAILRPAAEGVDGPAIKLVAGLVVHQALHYLEQHGGL